MRRLPASLISVLMVGSLLGGPASARTLTSHSDPDDVPTRPDIRRVWTDKSDTHIYVRIRAWHQLTKSDGFEALFDTKGDGEFDRLIEFANACYVWRVEDGFLGKFIGRRENRRPDGRTTACEVPKSWFRMGKPVTVVVKSDIAGGSHDDRAPNEGRYRGL